MGCYWHSKPTKKWRVVCDQEVTINALPKRVASCAGGVRDQEVPINALPKQANHSDGAVRILCEGVVCVSRRGGSVCVCVVCEAYQVRADADPQPLSFRGVWCGGWCVAPVVCMRVYVCVCVRVLSCLLFW